MPIMKVLLSSLLLFGVLANNLPFYGEDLKSSCDVVQSEHSKKMEGNLNFSEMIFKHIRTD